MEQDRQEWLERRKRGIGGSDVAAILGIHPYESQFDVWLEKRGEAVGSAGNEAMWWGTEMEPLLARRYTLTTGLEVFKPEPPLFVHPQHDFLVATPDALCKDDDERGVEFKTASAYLAHEWGEAGTDEIPRYYLTQVLHYMAVTGRSLWDVAVLIGGNDFRVYTVRANEDVQASITEKLVAWWTRYMVAGEMPPVDASESIGRWVEKKYPRQNPNRIPSTGAVDVMVAMLETARLQRAEAERLEAKYKNELKLLIGDASGIDGPDYRVTWNRVSDRKEVDWQGAFESVALGLTDSEREERLARYTRTVPGQRRFLLTPKRNKEGANA